MGLCIVAWVVRDRTHRADSLEERRQELRDEMEALPAFHEAMRIARTNEAVSKTMGRVLSYEVLEARQHGGDQSCAETFTFLVQFNATLARGTLYGQMCRISSRLSSEGRMEYVAAPWDIDGLLFISDDGERILLKKPVWLWEPPPSRKPSER
jgi:hypothetical protein